MAVDGWIDEKIDRCMHACVQLLCRSIKEKEKQVKHKVSNSMHGFIVAGQMILSVCFGCMWIRVLSVFVKRKVQATLYG